MVSAANYVKAAASKQQPLAVSCLVANLMALLGLRHASAKQHIGQPLTPLYNDMRQSICCQGLGATVPTAKYLLRVSGRAACKLISMAHRQVLRQCMIKL